MGFVTSWFHFWGDRCLKTLAFMVPIENMCGLRQFLFLFPKNMVHIRFAGQITTFAGVSPASSSIFQPFHPPIFGRRTGSGCGQHPFVADFRGQGLWDGRQLPWTTGPRKQRGANEVRIRRWWWTKTWRENSERTMGEESIERGFHGSVMGFHSNLMGFNGIWMGFNGGFHGILLRFTQISHNGINGMNGAQWNVCWFISPWH